MNINRHDYLRLQKAIYKPKLDAIFKVVVEHTGIPEKIIRAHCRLKDPVRARSLVQFLAKENTGCSLEIIGILTGNGQAWDHSSVVHNIKKIRDTITLERAGKLVYPQAKEEIDMLRCKVKTVLAEASNLEPI